MTHPAESDNRRLALVTTELAVGGAERCLVNLACGLARRQFEPVVYSLRPAPVGPAGALVEQLRAERIATRFLGVSSSWQALSAVRQLTALLREQRPALLQSFLYHANVIGSLAARRARVRRVVTGIRVADPRSWRNRWERWVTRSADRVVCVSEAVAQFMQTRVGVPERQLLVIPNGIDVARYSHVTPASPDELELSTARRGLVCVGRLHPQKGFDWLLPLAARFLPRLPDHDLVIVGAGDEEANLRRLAVDLGIESRVRLVGWRAPARIPAILAAADVVLIPSRWEGMPNVLLEAMAAGRPVVATRVEGVPEVLGPLADIQAVAPGDADAFIASVLKLASQPGEAAAWGDRNRQRVAEHFSLDAMVDRYADLYRQLL